MAQVRSGVFILWLASALVFVGSFAGALHPFGDSLAVFRPYLAGVFGLLGLAMLLTGPRRLAVAGVALTALGGATMIPPATDDGAGGPALTVYQKNLLWLLPDLAPVVADIRAADPDVVFLQEMHARNRKILDQLAPAYPSRHYCAFRTVGGVAVASRLPVVEGSQRCVEGLGFAAMQVTGPAGPLWIVSIHLHWPWPHQQPQDLATLRPILAALDGPVLIGGDFNMVPWSHTMAEIRRASGTRHAGFPGGTFDLKHPLLPIAIDHVLMPEDARLRSVEQRPALGSDHRGVLARIALP
ncbi:endonuclease/exonuclease/phosphatase family protein [Ovoidimarina sediminis]|uniref:endonuclease/exonuclease/phosphatase family protein n=1 Tax=Ovoidimarina sediminis TaxID=3079856 RepID=UPI00290B616B|nr:endonuclease/exonuclease/phosphatase family protein [Rhodophyticola sp. MJ-SS7]MDU8944450.1 endonuclease/exonuclease/phosphatase family protein [Rhodophyticola sp. MJ-SS7]